MTISCDPTDLARASTCYCFPGNNIRKQTAVASAIEIYLLITIANEGVPPPVPGIVLGNPDLDQVFGDPGTGMMFGIP